LTLARFTAYLTGGKTKKSTNSRTAKKNHYPEVTFCAKRILWKQIVNP